MKKEIVIWGAGGTGRQVFEQLAGNSEITVKAFVDSFKTGELFGVPIYAPEKLLSLQCDFIYLTTVAYAEVLEQIRTLGISESKVVLPVAAVKGNAREVFLENLARELYRKSVQGNVAEAGVFRGGFARLINKHFPDRRLYLFDTFQGFDDRDITYEEGYDENPARGDHFRETSVELVLSKMPRPEQVVICQGYVPESFAGIEDRFCFVNLDMDLYKPTLEALRWFYPRMNPGGGILIHDYFDTYTFPNLKKGVIEFAEETGAQTFPIGDDLSIFGVKAP